MKGGAASVPATPFASPALTRRHGGGGAPSPSNPNGPPNSTARSARRTSDVDTAAAKHAVSAPFPLLLAVGLLPLLGFFTLFALTAAPAILLLLLPGALVAAPLAVAALVLALIAVAMWFIFFRGAPGGRRDRLRRSISGRLAPLAQSLHPPTSPTKRARGRGGGAHRRPPPRTAQDWAREARELAGAWAAFFLLPFHGVLTLAVVATFSLAWSAAIGFAVFAFPRVPAWLSGWSHRVQARYTPRGWNARWPALVRRMGALLAPAFAYFPLEVVAPAAPPPADRRRRRRLYCYHPHGMYAFGLFGLVFRRASGWARALGDGAGEPGARPVLVAVASAVLACPGFGQLARWFGFVAASRASLARVLAADDPETATENGGGGGGTGGGTGGGVSHDVALIPGGVAEVLVFSQPPVDTLYLARRRGFCRLALQHGADLVPVYCFGETRTFIQYTDFARGLREALSRRCRVVCQLFRGRWFTLIPFRQPLRVVVGDPVRLSGSPHAEGTPIARPTHAQVDALHARYVAALRALFEAHKGRCPGYEDATLTIV